MSEVFPDARTLLKRHGLSAKKSWGQNFLVSERVYRAIVDATVASNADWVVEIGAGLGTLTMRLAQRVPEGRVFAVERDPDMLGVLEKELGHLEGVEVVPANALTYDFGPVARFAGGRLHVCGNLPYNIASQILFRIIEGRAHIRRAVVMLQREMATRLVASPGTKQYGAITVLLRAYADIRTVVHAPPGAFVPAPKVDSTVIRMDLLEEPRVPINDEQHFSDVVHAAFGQRRKTLRNALRARYQDAAEPALERAGIDGRRRGETLTIEEFAHLANTLVPDP